MNFLKNNTEIKIIPQDIKAITKANITNVSAKFFVATLKVPVEFKNNEQVEILISDQGNIVKFDSKVLKIENKLLSLSLPEKFRPVQRREYPRVNISIPVELKDNQNPEITSDSITENISGGGMQVISGKTFIVGSLLKAKFHILDKDSIETLLVVLRVENKCSNINEYFLSGQFRNLSSADKTTLIQVCFKRQLELKFKGISTDTNNFGGEKNQLGS